MRTIQISNGNVSHTAIMPTRQNIHNLREGQQVPNCFGKMAKVSSIFARRDDINGKAFVCFYTIDEKGFSVSGSMKEGEIYITLPLTNSFSSAEITAANRKAIQ